MLRRAAFLSLAFLTANLTMPQIQVKLVRSAIDRPERQKRTVEALGLNKMNSTATHEANPSILGMVNAVKHLLEVTEL